MKKRIYNILPHYYAPMCGEWSNDEEMTVSSHGVIYPYCNFHCAFCNNALHQMSEYTTYDENEFVAAILELSLRSKHFKFSGGEQTVNPFIRRDLEIVKELDGFTFLDTNGSNPILIDELLECGLIDVVGISLKGLNPHDAVKTAGITSTCLCWQNVFCTLKLVAQRTGVRCIVTYVLKDGAGMAEIEKFAKLLLPYQNVVLKVNNLLHKQHHQEGLVAWNKENFVDIMYSFVDRNPHWIGRVIGVPSTEAITQYNSILFL